MSAEEEVLFQGLLFLKADSRQLHPSRPLVSLNLQQFIAVFLALSVGVASLIGPTRLHWLADFSNRANVFTLPELRLR